MNLGGLPSEELILDGEIGRNLMTIFVQELEQKEATRNHKMLPIKEVPGPQLLRRLPQQDNLPVQRQYFILHTLEAGSLIRTFIHYNDYCSHKIEKQAGERNNQTSGLLNVQSPCLKLG